MTAAGRRAVPVRRAAEQGGLWRCAVTTETGSGLLCLSVCWWCSTVLCGVRIRVDPDASVGKDW